MVDFRLLIADLFAQLPIFNHQSINNQQSKISTLRIRI